MERTIYKRIDDAIKNNHSGKFIVQISEEEKNELEESIRSGRMRTQLVTYEKICFLNLKETYAETEIINYKDFVNEMYDIIEKFLIDEREGAFLSYPEDFKDVINKHNEVYEHLDLIIDERFKKSLDGKTYRCWKLEVKEKEEGFVLSKNNIAKYEAYVFNKGNIPYVEITRLGSYNFYKPNSKSYIYDENNKSITCLYKNFDTLLEYNGIDDKTIRIREDSLSHFYGFDDVFFVKPTKKWIDMWYNYDCPNLYKEIPNINGTTNDWGIHMFCWRNQLVESSWSAVYVDEDITDEEMKHFGKEGTAIYNQMQRVLKARGISEEDKKERIKQAELFEEKIQNAIDSNLEYILISTLIDLDSSKVKDYMSVEDMKKEIYSLDGKYGLDCGFIYFKVNDMVVIDLFKEIAEYDKDSYRGKDGSLRLNLPIYPQSNTIKSTMAKYIKEIVSKKTEFDLSYWTVLD